jgi:hypothetical protein
MDKLLFNNTFDIYNYPCAIIICVDNHAMDANHAKCHPRGMWQVSKYATHYMAYISGDYPFMTTPPFT